MSNVPEEVREAMATAISGAPFASSRALGKVDAALSALEAAGWVCVPVEPSVAMQEAVARIPIHVGHQHPVHIPTAYVRELLSALLTASNPKEKPDV